MGGLSDFVLGFYVLYPTAFCVFFFWKEREGEGEGGGGGLVLLDFFVRFGLALKYWLFSKCGLCVLTL